MSEIVENITSPSFSESIFKNNKNTANSDLMKEEIQVVEFILGDEQYAINLFDVREVMEYTQITRVPNSQVYFRGIIDLRGEVTPVVDLKSLLKIHTSHNLEEVDEQNCRLMVLDNHVINGRVSIMVTDVTSVSTFHINQIDTNSVQEMGDDAHIMGIIKKEVRTGSSFKTELVIWIDIADLLKGLEIGKGK